MLVYGLISPHPPIILPEVGKAETAKVSQTISALKQAAASFGQANPTRLIIISPHEEHGFEVPLYYLKPNLPPGIEVERILVTESSYEYYHKLGLSYGSKIEASSDRYGIVASGDLSHVLKADGPYGYHPSGPKLDEIIVQAVGDNNSKALLSINPTLLKEGAECGLPSMLFLLGAIENTKLKPRVLSYEGPFGVGYLVATFGPPVSSKGQVAITSLARHAIEHYLQTGEILPMRTPVDPILVAPAGTFVSLHNAAGELRGCIGTTTPTKQSLAEEVVANAIAASTQDPRFIPITQTELSSLVISVDVLESPTPVTNLVELNPKRYGIIVAAADGRSGVLLPGLEEVTSVDQQISISRDKAGIGPDEPINIFKFLVLHYSELSP